MTIGQRVAVLIGPGEIEYGVYVGDEIPPDGALHESGFKNPKLLLDSGEIRWGYQVHWVRDDEAYTLLGSCGIDF